LRDSVENYDNYDPVELAQRLERHDLVFFRQIAANIYRKNKRWEKSIALSKQDKLFKDAIETAAMSGKSEVVEELLRYVSWTGFYRSSAYLTVFSLLISAAANAMLECYMLATISSLSTWSWRSHGATV